MSGRITGWLRALRRKPQPSVYGRYWGTAEMRGRIASAENVQNDPKRTCAGTSRVEQTRSNNQRRMSSCVQRTRSSYKPTMTAVRPSTIAVISTH